MPDWLRGPLDDRSQLLQELSQLGDLPSCPGGARNGSRCRMLGQIVIPLLRDYGNCVGAAQLLEWFHAVN